MKGAAFGDLHLGQGASIGRAPGDRLAEQGAALEQFLARARELDLGFLLFTGDAFERRSPSPDEILVLERALVRHRDALGCEIFAVPGNHDVANADAGTALDIMAEAGLISLRRTPSIDLMTSDVALCTLPWVPVHRLAAVEGISDRDAINRAAARLLEDTARVLYSGAKDAGARTVILLTHFSALGATTDAGADVSVFREPVLNVDDLAEFDSIVMGHIHKAQTVGVQKRAHYVGSLIPLNFGESTPQHGYLMLETGDGVVHTNAVWSMDHRPFVTIDADLIDTDVDGEMLADGAWIGYSGRVPLSTPRIGADPENLPYLKLRYRCTEEQAVQIDAIAIKRMLESRIAHRAWVVPVVERAVRVKQTISEDASDLATLEAYLRSSDVEVNVERILALGDEYLSRARS